jgi:hypothetical protein
MKKVAEFSAPQQKIIKQDCIEPEFLKVIGEYDTILDKPDEFDYIKYKILLGMTRAKVDQMHSEIGKQIKDWVH